mgnify:CR=1 FL=1
MKLVLRNESGSVLDERKVKKGETPGDRLFVLLVDKTWILEAGDTIDVVDEEKTTSKSEEQKSGIAEKKPFDTVCFILDHGKEELEEALRSLKLDELKAVFRFNRIDRTTNLRKKDLSEKEIISKIMEVSISRSRKGDAFRNIST